MADRMLKQFAHVLKKLRLPSPNDGHAVVALSGGSDSVALMHLLKKVFPNKLTAATIDHDLREDSSADAARASEIAGELGIPCSKLKVSWNPRPQTGVSAKAREQRFSLLIEHCLRNDATLLFLGHHQDDQLETFVYRLASMSGLDGLTCIPSITWRVGTPSIKLVRPLLPFSKADLKDYCCENGLTWIEDSSNFELNYHRNRIRKVFSEEPWIKPHLKQLIDVSQFIRNDMDKQVKAAISDVTKHTTQSKNVGYIFIDFHKFKQLAPPIGRRVLLNILLHIGGVKSSGFQQAILCKYYNSVVSRTTAPDKCISMSSCNVVPHSVDSFIVARATPRKAEKQLTEIKIGQSLIWDCRFTILLEKYKGSSGHVKSEIDLEEVFFVKHMDPTDLVVAKNSIRRVKASKLPLKEARGGLPVIVDKNGSIVAVPHLNYIDVRYGLVCQCSFKPVIPIFNSTLN